MGVLRPLPWMVRPSAQSVGAPGDWMSPTLSESSTMADQGLSTTRQAGRFKDARGKPVTLLDPYLLHKLRRHDVIPAAPLAEIARDIGSGWARAGRLIFTFVWPCVQVGRWLHGPSERIAPVARPSGVFCL
jgi:hypothetical protein